MSTEKFGPEPEGATPLSEEDFLGLKPKWVATRGDLNQAEAQNILRAAEKHFNASHQLSSLLDDHFVRQLHKDMFSDVWTWAGKYRQVETSIGVDPRVIAESLNVLMNNALFWFRNAGAGELDRTVCIVHHELVQIHPFPNGNGRASRLFADLLLVSLVAKCSIGVVADSKTAQIPELHTSMPCAKPMRETSVCCASLLVRDRGPEREKLPLRSAI